MIQKIRRLSKEQKAFTLIELMIVVAIIAILAALALPQYNKYRQKAAAKEMLTGARACAMEIVAECMTQGGSVTFKDDDMSDNFSTCADFNASEIENTINIKTFSGNTCGNFHVNANDHGSNPNPYHAECKGDYQNDVSCTLVAD